MTSSSEVPDAAAAIEVELPDAIGPWLEARVPGFGDYIGSRKFADGQSNPTYLISTSRGDRVLRAQPPGTLLPSAHRVDREFRVMRMLATTEFPVPGVLYLSEGDNPLGRMFYIMERVDGRIFWDPALPGLTPEARAVIYRSMNRTLADLHAIDPDAVGLGDFGRPGNFMERQTRRWIHQYQASRIDTNPRLESVIPWLLANIPADDGRVAIVHGDYRIDNLIFEPGRCEIAAVLDWELSTLGHPLADLASQCVQLRLPNRGLFMRGLGGVNRGALGIPDEDAYVAGYCRRLKIDKPGNWGFHTTFSLFRLAAILTGVRRRAHDGNASNPDKAIELAKAIPVLTELALANLDSL